MTRSENSEIDLPLGIKLRGGAVKQLMTSLGWIVAVGAMAYTMYGPPKEVLTRLAKLEQKVDDILAVMPAQRSRQAKEVSKPKVGEKALASIHGNEVQP